MGNGLAGRLAQANQIIIGSRDPARAAAAAKGIPGAVGMDYAGASKAADVAVITVPDDAIGLIAPLSEHLSGKLVISVVTPLKFEGGLAHFGREDGSAAEELARSLPGSRVATAFNNIPAGWLEKGDFPPTDVLVAADTKEVYEEAADLVKSIPNLRPLYAGPLSQAIIVETITALLINLAKLNGTGVLGTKFPSRKG